MTRIHPLDWPIVPADATIPAETYVCRECDDGDWSVLKGLLPLAPADRFDNVTYRTEQPIPSPGPILPTAHGAAIKGWITMNGNHAPTMGVFVRSAREWVGTDLNGASWCASDGDFERFEVLYDPSDPQPAAPTKPADPLDETDHRDRFDADGDRWVWTDGAWHLIRREETSHIPQATLADVARYVGGPLTFADDTRADA